VRVTRVQVKLAPGKAPQVKADVAPVAGRVPAGYTVGRQLREMLGRLRALETT
jgi:hypothetical protein